MPRNLVLEFTKMNGAGNDFIVIDNRFYQFSDQELSKLAPRLCRRRFGIGADGLIGFASPREEGHHYRMRYINADGSIGTMCGNGARCLVRFGRMAGIEDAEIRFETDAGVIAALSPESHDEPVRIYLGPPERYQADISLTVAAAEEAGPLHYIWTGTEHLVCFVPEAAAAPVDRWGPALRGDESLPPPGANVNFVEVMNERTAKLRTRTYEKGVEAETYACGTGAVASAIVACLSGRVDTQPVEVEMPGGTLRVGFRVEGRTVSDVYLEGPAESVFRGSLEI